MENEKSYIRRKNICNIENSLSRSLNQNALPSGQKVAVNTKVFSLKRLYFKNKT